MKKQKKSFKNFYENSVFSKGEFYVKLSLIFLIVVVFLIIFFLQDGLLFFEYYPYTSHFKGDPFQVHVIDVGNGDAMLIKFPNNQTMMIDAGQEYYSDKVSSYVQQYLWSENLSQIDYLVLTHSDSDHVGGAKAIFDNFKVVNLYRPKVYSKIEDETLKNKEDYKVVDSSIYDEVIQKAYKEKCNMIFSETGISFQLAECKVEFLSPLNEAYSNSNNYSAVIKITCQSKKFLFVGDAEITVEEQLIEKYGDLLKSDVLKIGHHGSYTSTSQGFLNVVNPSFAILSCGETEYFPNKEVLARLKEKKINILSTGVRGSYALTVKNDEIIFANSQKPSNNLAIIFTIFLILVFIIWENPFKKIKPLINRIKND